MARKKAVDCDYVRHACDEAENTQAGVYKQNVEHQIARILKSPYESISKYQSHKDKKLVNRAYEAHKQVYDRLANFLMKSGELSFWQIPPSWQVTGLLNFITGTFKGTQDADS